MCVTLAAPFSIQQQNVNRNRAVGHSSERKRLMARYLLIFALSLIASLSFACANPAANKSKASVTNAAPETNPAKPAGAETLLISPENSKVEFIAAKVT